MRKQLAALGGIALLCLSFGARADFIGDFAPATTAVCGQYTTYSPSTGLPATLAGSPVLSVYKIGDGTNSATESTTGVTHAEDFDSRTGMNRVCVDTSADGTFYSAGAQFSVVITTGTIGGSSIAGSEVKNFALNKVSALRPTTAGRTLVVDASGLADANTVKLGPTGSGTAQTARDIGASVLLSTGTGTGQLDFTSGVVKANPVQWNGTTVATPDTAGYPKVTIKDGTGTGEIDTNAGAIVSVTTTTTATTATNLTNLPAITAGWLTATGIASNAFTEAKFDTTAGSFAPLHIVDQGTAQGATATTLQLRSAAAFSDSELVGATITIVSATSGAGQSATITAYVGSTDTATVATWPTTPSGTIVYKVFGVPPGAGGTVSIGAGGITSSSFAASAITAASIASNAITSAKIAADAIGASQIADGAIDEATFAATGGFGQLGVIDQGTAQAATSTTLQFRSAANFADSEIIGATVVITSGSTGVGQSRTVSAYVSSTDTATLDSAWTTTPTGTIKYAVFGTALGASSALTAADVWAYGTRELTAIDEDRTTLDLNATYVGGLTVLDEDLTTIDLNATAIGSLTTDPTGVTTLLSRLGSPSDLGTGATVAANLVDIENETDDIGVAGAGLTAADDAVMTRLGAPAGASVSADILALPTAASISTRLFTDQRIVSGTCSSGSTTTCVDAALTQAAASQLQDRIICFDDQWCALITTFNPATDTATMTKVAPSTRASKAYTIFPATAL